MEEDPEKRFHSIMDKLFHTPKSVSSPSSSSGVESSRGKKRRNPESALALVEPKTRVEFFSSSQRTLASAEASLCRPWDRGDLMRRVATFKSMTWFAKPKVVNAVNCARRGWINVDMDIIECQACGTRLLFSTPSSWTHQQVEKAALVFSLKLDNGHKSICPWINNACDERLAEFPPTPPPVLFDKFKERSSVLSQLLALPVISSSAIEYVRSTQLEDFLRQSTTLDYGNVTIHTSQVESLGNVHEADSANLYYQAQKLISLCGWEPRLLPYAVDCKDRLKQLSKDADIWNSSHGVNNGQNTSIGFYSASTNENVQATEDSNVLSGLQADPQSIVLDCKLCGASVGLWAFSTVPQPLEVLRLVGCIEVNNGKDSSNKNQVDDRGAIVNSTSKGTFSSIDRPSGLNLTIAGGPPPTKQNFKATISFPIIGRNLRTRFSYDTDFRDRAFNAQEPESGSGNKDLLGKDVSQAESSGTLKSKEPDQGQPNHASGDQCSSGLNLDNDKKGSSLGKESDSHIALEETDTCREGYGLDFGMDDSIMKCLMDNIHDIVTGMETCFDSNSLLEKAQNAGSLDSPSGSLACSQARTSSVSEPGGSVTVGDLVTVESCDQRQVPTTNNSFGKDAASKIDSRKCETQPDNYCMLSTQTKDSEGKTDGMQTLVNGKTVASSTVKDRKQISDSGMEFDPIRQHRHFCPWIISTNSGAAGWQQTLSALVRQKEYASPPTKSPPSTSIIKVDDPITSVRKLFMSPSAKRMKPTHRSS